MNKYTGECCDYRYGDSAEGGLGNSIRFNEWQNIWRAVVLQALSDVHLKPRTRKMRSARNKALCWINIDNEDFKEVCQLAGVDPFIVVAMKNSDKPPAVSGVKFML